MPARPINQYTVAVDLEELRAAEEHIEALEQQLLHLKDVKRELEALRQEHRRLRRTAEGRLARFLTAPGRWFGGRSDDKSTQPTAYEKWLENHRVSPAEIGRFRQEEKQFAYRPLISILTPTFNAVEEFVSAAVASVVSQAYGNWELILVDDGSDQAGSGLATLAKLDSRIALFVREDHGGISEALNTALSHARGEWIALLDHDDLLEPDALFRVVEFLQADVSADVIYSDEDKIVDGRFASPLLKPDWSPEFFTSYDYLGHLIVMRRSLAEIGFRSECDGAQDYDLLLRVAEKTQRFCHIPRVLYHWRRTAQSTAHNIRRKPGALEAGRRALRDHLMRRGQAGSVSVDWKTHAYRVRRKTQPNKLTLVVIGGDQADASRIRSRTNFPDLEVVTATLTNPFGLWSGNWLLFLDHDLEPIEPEWASVMLEQLQERDVGAVGARILTSMDTVESAGLLLGPNGRARHSFAGFPRHFAGANRQLQVIRNYSAISASCLLTRRQIFERLGGFDQTQPWPICAGIHFCLRLRDAGMRIASVPYAEVRRISNQENTIGSCPDLEQQWPDAFRHDPFYNLNLSGERGDFSLAVSSPCRVEI